jgi:hypothetical protein
MPSYTQQDLQNDMFNAMKSRPNGGFYSGRALGNNANLAMWTPDKVHSYYEGIVTSHNLFFYYLGLRDFARLVICESMQESTGDYNLGVKPVNFKDHTSQGIIQVTSGSVVLDYYNWGQPIIGVSGKMAMSPSAVPRMNFADPGLSVVMWAWYTSNGVKMGVSMNEYGNRVKWNIRTGGVTRDFGNCMWTWLGGPHNDRHNPATSSGYEDYYKRILDYYTQSGFGSKAEFDALLDTKLDTGIRAMYATQNNAIDNRDTCFGVDKIGFYE